MALVTGGSRGIGRGAAERLAENHATVVISYRQDEAAARDVVRLVQWHGAAGDAITVDLAEPAAGVALVEAVLERHGRIDSVVNNAGIAERHSLTELSEDVWHRTLAINLSAPFAILRRAALAMIEGDGGSIVNVGSPASLNGGVTGAHYAASKAGLIGMTVSSAKELAPHGVRVNLIEPAFVDTDLVRGFVADDPGLTLVPPLGRRGDPAEVGALIAFLCSPAASYVTGARIAVTGGA
ncbi:MAG: SDR family oxidoreductase [Actinobacteria bacterium]|nr:SDR family oxidoreductase [Actinomycetota bacterium]